MSEWQHEEYAVSVLCFTEYDTLARLGISDPQSFIKKRFKADAVEYLTSCCVGQLIRDQIDSEVDEVISSKTWSDVMVCHRVLMCWLQLNDKCTELSVLDTA